MYIQGAISTTFKDVETMEEFYNWASTKKLCCWSVGFNGSPTTDIYHVWLDSDQSPSYSLRKTLKAVVRILKKIVKLGGKTNVSSFTYDGDGSCGSIYIDPQQHIVKSIGFDRQGNIKELNLKW